MSSVKSYAIGCANSYALEIFSIFTLVTITVIVLGLGFGDCTIHTVRLHQSFC